MRVVIGTNVVISRFLSLTGPSARIFTLWEAGTFELLVSEDILTEYVKTLTEPRIKLRHSEIEQIVMDYRAFGTVVQVSMLLTVVEADPDDNKFLECAVAGGADYIVSGDKRLLALKEYSGVQVLSPAMFLVLLASGQG